MKVYTINKVTNSNLRLLVHTDAPSGRYVDAAIAERLLSLLERAIDALEAWRDPAISESTCRSLTTRIIVEYNENKPAGATHGELVAMLREGLEPMPVECRLAWEWKATALLATIDQQARDEGGKER